MGKGRPRKPNHLKLLHGDLEKHPERARDEPQAVDRLPECPEYLDAVAKAKWVEITEALHEMKLLSIAEQSLLEMYCLAYSRFREVNDSVNKVGVVVVRKNKQGETVACSSPFSVELHKYMDTLRRIGAELGLSYISRAKISMTPEQEHQTGIKERTRA